MKTIITYLVLFSIITIGIIYIPNVFQKGGVTPKEEVLIACFYLTIAIVFNLSRSDLNGIKERIGAFVLSLFISGAVSIFLTLFFIKIKYGDKTWDLWEPSEQILTNAIQYVSFTLLVMSITKIFIAGRISK